MTTTTTTLVCEWCGGTFRRTGQRGPMPRFCHPAHRQAAYRSHHPGPRAAEAAALARIEADAASASCCAGPPTCPYHQGMRDGVELLGRFLRGEAT